MPAKPVLKICEACKRESLIRPGGRFCSYECAASVKIKRPKTYTMTHYILAIDPGSKNVGYALYEHESKAENATLLRQGIVHYDSLVDFLGTMGYVTHLVYEIYRIRPGGRQNVGSDAKVIQAIGKLDMWSATLGIPSYTQEPSILPMAAKIAGYTLPRGHLRDDMSAVLHGAFWLRKRGWYVSALEREKAS